MKLSEVRDQAVKSVKDAVATAFQQGVDISTMLVALRGNEGVAAVSCSIENPQHASLVVRAAATGFSADILVWISDTYKATTLLSPISGKEWQRNEMQAVAEFYEGREKGWLVDAITVLVANRAGDLAASMLPYRTAGGRLEWIDEGDPDWDSTAGEEVGGIIPRILREAMKEPTLTQSMDAQIREMMAVDHEMAMVAQDLASCQTLVSLDQRPVLLADDGSTRASTLDKMRDVPEFLKVLERLIDKIRSN